MGKLSMMVGRNGNLFGYLFSFQPHYLVTEVNKANH